MDLETYDKALSLFSAAGFKTQQYGLGHRGYINLGDLSWIEFIGFKATPEMQVDIQIENSKLEEITITELAQVEYIIDQFKLSENKDIQYGENQT
jgi:hypothetical protein